MGQAYQSLRCWPTQVCVRVICWIAGRFGTDRRLFQPPISRLPRENCYQYEWDAPMGPPVSSRPGGGSPGWVSGYLGVQLTVCYHALAIRAGLSLSHQPLGIEAPSHRSQGVRNGSGICLIWVLLMVRWVQGYSVALFQAPCRVGFFGGGGNSGGTCRRDWCRVAAPHGR
jgi:hypothetical protein